MEHLGLCGNYSSITIFRENGVWCKDNGHKRTNDHDQCAEPYTAGAISSDAPPRIPEPPPRALRPASRARVCSSFTVSSNVSGTRRYFIWRLFNCTDVIKRDG